jgi:hypothetical protein
MPTMPTVFDKLNLKDQQEILVLNAPASFAGELKGLNNIRVVRSLRAAKDVAFSLAFVTRQAELDSLSTALIEKATDDPLLWFAYPKGTSKKYTCEFNRDKGWNVLRESGFDTVRQVAVDEDWSALRFRRARFIRKPPK